MKILYLINYAGCGGTEKYVLRMARAVSKAGIKCYFAYNESGQLSEQMAKEKISTFQFEMKSPYDLKAAKTLAAICKQNKIDIIHAQHPRENYIAVLSKMFYSAPKVVYTSHILIENSTAWKIANKLVGSKCDKAIAVCNAGKKLLCQNGFSAKKTDVIFNGIPLQCGFEAKDIKTALGVDRRTFVFCALTRYSEEKGVEFLVDCMARLKQLTDKRFVLLIAGTGENYDAVGQKIKALGLEDCILRLGYRNDTSDILEASNVFVNLSKTEALSFAIIEALSHGLPCVVTNVGGTSDIVNDSSDGGISVEYGDVESAANAMLTLMCNKELYIRHSMGALKNVKDNFDENNMIQKTIEVYKTLLKGKKTHLGD